MKEKKFRQPSFGLALIPILAMAVLLAVGYGIYKIRPQVLLVAAAFITACLGLILRYPWKEMEKGIVESISKAMPAILIMLSVGILIGSWIASGTIPMIIYYGLKLISPSFFSLHGLSCLLYNVNGYRNILGNYRDYRRGLYRHCYGARDSPRSSCWSHSGRGLFRR